MCLMLYIGCREPIRNAVPTKSSPAPLKESPAPPVISIEELRENEMAVRQWFSMPYVYFVGSHTGCSCGFPHVLAEEPIEFYEGMFDTEAEKERANDLLSTAALIQIVRKQLGCGTPVQLYPIWNGDEVNAPKGSVSWRVKSLTAETLVFTEGFLYEIQ